jgi:hypothetical protein
MCRVNVCSIMSLLNLSVQVRGERNAREIKKTMDIVTSEQALA